LSVASRGLKFVSDKLREAATATISVVVPVLNEVALIPELSARLAAALEGLGRDFEVVFVDDGSTDGTADALAVAHREDARFRSIRLSRNFGHQAAVTAGLHYVSGDLVCVMDGDLQDPPEVLPALVAEWEAGSDVVYAIRETRKENPILVALYEGFYRVLARMSSVPMPLDAGDFCLMSSNVVTHLNALPERERFVRGLRTWVGFRQTGMPYDRAARSKGESKYSLMALVRLAMTGIVSFSDKPLLLVMVAGLFTSLAAFGYAGWLVAYRLVFGGVITGYASMMASILFLSGIQLTAMGIIGIYLSTVFKEIKGRPTFIVASSLGFASSASQTTEIEVE
jgi:glycosyltransferase involved in cell wall biosynthesis